MSFYNMLFGQNPHSDVVLAMLDLKETDIERFRDCGINEEGIHIYTRTGGGNRDDYPNEKLTTSEYYLRDEDDDFDCTYATYYFKFPEHLKDDILKLLDVEGNGVPASIIKKCKEVWNRPQTDDDKWREIYNIQQQICNQLRMNLEVYETNGHTIVPLSDDAMGRLLQVAEKNDFPGREGEFAPYSIRPYKLFVETEKPLYSHDKERLYRVKIDLGKKWEIDQPVWERYKQLFAAKYPKAIGEIAKWVEKEPEYKTTSN